MADLKPASTQHNLVAVSPMVSLKSPNTWPSDWLGHLGNDKAKDRAAMAEPKLASTEHTLVAVSPTVSLKRLAIWPPEWLGH
jgi:hypothetical protein